jgi:hypothetical protein
VIVEHVNGLHSTYFAASVTIMGAQPPNKPQPSSAQLKRQQRLAEELRANLKRRKAAARREKSGGSAGEDGAGDGGCEPEAGKSGDGSHA